jgi:very-short-patch-repair endonuclease
MSVMVSGEIVVEDVPWSEYEKDPLTAIIDTQHGVVARWQALRHLSEKAIRHRLGSGRWRRAHRRIYLTYGGPTTLAQRHWIAVLAATPGPSIWASSPACVGGLSALLVHGLRNITSSQVHLLIPASRRVVAPAGVVVHRSREFVDDDRHPVARPPTTTISRAVVDAASWARSENESRLIIAASFQQRLVTAEEVDGVLRRMRNVPRRHLIKTTVDDASGGSHTLGELALVKICRLERLPLPTRQARFRDLAGRTRFLDAVFDPWRVAVEIDGAHHDEVRQRWDDAERDNALVLATYNILRYPTHVLRQHPRQVATQIRLALMAAGWRPDG